MSRRPSLTVQAVPAFVTFFLTQRPSPYLSIVQLTENGLLHWQG